MKPRQEFYTDEDYSKYLRAYYAGQAMQGIMANATLQSEVSDAIESGKTGAKFGKEILAFCAVEIADALIAELNKTEQP